MVSERKCPNIKRSKTGMKHIFVCSVEPLLVVWILVPYRFHFMVDAFFVYSILHGLPVMSSCDVSDAEVLGHSELGHASGRLLHSTGKLYEHAEVGLGLEAGGGTDRHAGALTLDAQV